MHSLIHQIAASRRVDTCGLFLRHDVLTPVAFFGLGRVNTYGLFFRQDVADETVCGKG